ncbi:porin OmpA [Aeromonas rivipollensis]|uniref:porin OmpA n=1 Tax=Aeromonas rivipollensis TaxID=948519 RepID=UPI0027D93515|nr:porin OmpA [uncultured Aeromonas sp.]MDU1144860.1 porin OmpA [Aeromonas hydrophila]
MNKTLITLLVSGLLAANAQAAGQDNTWYGGAKLGWSNFYGVDESNSISTEDKDDDEVGAGAFAGYQINQNLGIELGYDYLGKLKYNGTRNGAVFNDDVEAQLAQLTLKLGFPVANNLDLYGRVGGGYGWTSSDKLDNDNDFTFVGALGAEYAFNLDWAARLEYQYSTPYGSREDTGLRMDNGLLSLAAVYRFGQVPPAMPVAAPAPAPEPVVVDKQFTLSSDVLFDFNKSTLKPEAGQALDTLYTQIEEARPKDGSATVIGYTDRLGSDAYNQKLSEQRAQTVADYLVGKGLPAGKVNVEGRGESSPVTGESCTSQSRRELIVCLAPDRRVEVKVQGVSEVQQ